MRVGRGVGTAVSARFALCGLFSMVACAYDWSTRAVTGESDAGESGAGDAASALDAASADAAAGQVDAANDGCACCSLAAQIVEWRPKAKECNGVLAMCLDSVLDECGCMTAVDDHNSPASTTFTSLVTQYRDENCQRPATCPDSCPSLQASVCSSSMECMP